MHPIDQLCSEYGITRYRLSQRTGIRETTFSQMVANNTKLKSMKFGTVSSVAKSLGITLDELEKKFEEYENNPQSNYVLNPKS